MRADVMQAMRIKPDLWPVESDLSEILSFWFDIGLLDMKMISWDSPASLLEKLIVYEAVHKISSWLDLRNRLDSDRRCFAFFHNKMPYDPLIFVEVALTDKVSSSIHDLLDETLPITTYDDINTAVFYSISNTQRGMVGISLGNFLIKQVVSELKREFPSIETFVTLSPIPGFIKWLMNHDKQRYYSDFYELTSSLPEYDESLLSVVLLYLSTTQNDKVVDPVAHFHLSNGASILSVNWEADKSSKGLKNSAGIMVNYKYELSKID
ncbi:malonyl-CoA decarboxylase, mitochondrial-like, partial [Symsagittifera roscoffensis]|uniref:malonyl-CoA decarboxylase, mitochondrial-like n=1 Tax=Symsagittifera roscoffensis TaxID=84072 RepID=UPI00307BC14C